MPIYQLTIHATPDSETETLQFIASNTAMAVTVANRYPAQFPAELWSDGKRLCYLHYDEPAGSWMMVDYEEE